MLITWHLYQSHKDIDPGELTDLRSASVNNDNFAQVVVRHNLYKHLQHRSTLLQNQITEYVNSSSTSCDTTISGSDNKAPKVGSLVAPIIFYCHYLSVDHFFLAFHLTFHSPELDNKSFS